MRFIALTLSFVLTLVFATAPAGAGYKDDIGYTKLQLELGGAIPNGSGVGVSQTEAPANPPTSPPPPYDYLPDTSGAEFSGKTFLSKSGSGGISGHATTVAQYYYGNSVSIAPGITSINNYEANDWIGTGFLNTGTTSAPKTESQEIENHSWIGSIDSGGAGDVAALRRFDYAIQQSGFLGVVGLNNGNGGSVPALLGSFYNGVSVGLSSGNHSYGTNTADGSGRTKPELVAPSNLTSFATPMVAAAAALLRQGATANAAKPVTMKAILMAGATKSQFPTWSRNATHPLDAVYGAGQLNVYNNYHILASGQQPSSTTATVRPLGWDYTTTTSGSRLYFLDIPAGASSSSLSVILTWNRKITDGVSGRSWGNPSSSLANLTLKLYAASGFAIGALIDSSTSAVDNVEHVYEPTLAPGRYAIEVTADTSNVPYGLAWYSVPNVTIAATTPSAAETGPVPGVFTITRGGDTTTALTVNYTITGTAMNGTDYSSFQTSITIPAGASSAAVTVTPIPDTLAEGDETVVLTLSSDPVYSFGPQSTATITIHDKPFDAWRFNHFTPDQLGDPSPGNITIASANPASDGIANLIKYALNLDPLTAQAASLPSYSVSGNIEPQFILQRNLQATDITLNVEASNDLTQLDGWQTIASLPSSTSIWTTNSGATVSDSGGLVMITDGASIDSRTQRFFRLQVTLP